MEVTRSRTLVTDVFKNLSNFNSEFIKTLFFHSTYAPQGTKKLFISSRNAIKFENKSLSVIGSRIWNSPNHSAKEVSRCKKFRQIINLWSGM